MTTTIYDCRVCGFTAPSSADPVTVYLAFASDDLCQGCADGDFKTNEEY